MDSWAENGFGAAQLGGALARRIVKSVRIQSMAPSKTFFSAACGDQAAVTGYYRMTGRPEEGEFTPEAILAAHRERTLKRVRGAATVLLVQDGTDLNFATHGGCSGLGVISRNKGSAGTLGIHMTGTFAVSGDGLPLGVPRTGFDCPDGRADRGRPPEERKPARWLRGWRDSPELAAAVPGTRVVPVMDREGDIAALFAERQAARVCWSGPGTTGPFPTAKACSPGSAARRRTESTRSGPAGPRPGGPPAARRASPDGRPERRRRSCAGRRSRCRCRKRSGDGSARSRCG